MEKSREGRINPGHRHLESSKYITAICLYFSKKINGGTDSLEYLVITSY